jgi:hypothetical protein
MLRFSQLRQNFASISGPIYNLVRPVVRVECYFVQGIQSVGPIEEVFIHFTIISSKSAAVRSGQQRQDAGHSLGLHTCREGNLATSMHRLT